MERIKIITRKKVKEKPKVTRTGVFEIQTMRLDLLKNTTALDRRREGSVCTKR